MRHRLSWLFAAVTRVATLLSGPSNTAREFNLFMITVTALLTMLMMVSLSISTGLFSVEVPAVGNPDLSSRRFLYPVTISSRNIVRSIDWICNKIYSEFVIAPLPHSKCLEITLSYWLMGYNYAIYDLKFCRLNKKQ